MAKKDLDIDWKGIEAFKDERDYHDRMYVIYDFLVTRDLPSVAGIKESKPLQARVEIVYDTGEGEDHGKDRKIIEGNENLVLKEVENNSYLTVAEIVMFHNRWTDARYKNLYSKYKGKELLPISVVSRPNELLQRALARANKSAKEVSPNDFSTLYQVLKDKRDLTRDKAITVANELGIDPVDLMFDKIKIPVWGCATEITDPERILVSEFLEKPMTVCPRDIHTPLTRAIRVEDDNSMYQNHILFYDFTNDISDSALNKICVVGFTDYYKDFDDKMMSYTRYEVGLYQMYGRDRVLKIMEAGKDVIIRKGFKPHFVAPVKAIVDADALKYSETLNTKKAQELGRELRAKEIVEEEKPFYIPTFLQSDELDAWRKKGKTEVFSFKQYSKDANKTKAEINKTIKQLEKEKAKEAQIKETLQRIRELTKQTKQAAKELYEKTSKEIPVLDTKKGKKRA